MTQAQPVRFPIGNLHSQEILHSSASQDLVLSAVIACATSPHASRMPYNAQSLSACTCKLACPGSKVLPGSKGQPPDRPLHALNLSLSQPSCHASWPLIP